MQDRVYSLLCALNVLFSRLGIRGSVEEFLGADVVADLRSIRVCQSESDAVRQLRDYTVTYLAIRFAQQMRSNARRLMNQTAPGSW